MKVLLPDYDYVFEDGSAEVKDGVLYIYRPGAYKDVMYKLTYLIFGKKECFFCHKNFVEPGSGKIGNNLLTTQTTLDHLKPQEFGGPTIPNNMRPSCSFCNNSKGNLYPEEFEQYRILTAVEGKEGRKLRHDFKQKIRDDQERRRYGEIESLPKEWYSKESYKNIYVNFWLMEPLGYMYHKQEKFLRKYKRLPKPIIISSNRFLLDGFNTILLAKYNHISKIDTIVLENVVFCGFPDNHSYTTCKTNIFAGIVQKIKIFFTK